MTDYYSLVPSFKKEIPKFFNKSNKFAILEVKSDPKSQSYKILENLKKDFAVFPINQEEDKILGEKCYSSISQISPKPEVVIITTSPNNTLQACQECLKNGILNIWIEIGSESKESIDFCKQNKIKAIFLHSILKERINPSAKYNFKEES